MKFSETISGTILAVLLSSVLVFSLSGCEDQGPLEEAGEELEETTEDSGELIEDE